MKNLNLSIPTPCFENWSKFTSTHAGAFCQACSKEVIDFTSMRDDEILHYFTTHSNETCGRFRSDQMKNYSELPQLKINPGFKLLSAGLLVLLVGLASQSVEAHRITEKPIIETVETNDHSIMIIASEHTIKGVIKSEDGDLMPGVNIYLKNGTEGTVSNNNGAFEFPRKLETGEVLVFSFIGYETIEYAVPNEPTTLLEILMRFDTHIVLGKVAVDQVYGQQRGIQKIWQRIKGVF